MLNQYMNEWVHSLSKDQRPAFLGVPEEVNSFRGLFVFFFKQDAEEDEMIRYFSLYKLNFTAKK